MKRLPLLLLVLACRTAGSGFQPRYPALVPARTPDEARTYAPRIADPLLAAEVAWLMGNDRELARAQIDRGLKEPVDHAPLYLLRALIDLAELDRKRALDHLLAVIEKAPKSDEAEIAMIVLYDQLAENRADGARIRAALERSGLLSDAPSPAAHVAIATAILLRIDPMDRDRVKQLIERGGWLTTFESHGPLAPVNDTFFTGMPEQYRGMVPPKRAIFPVGRRIPVTAGDAPGVYRLSGCFEVEADAGQLALEAHLPAPSRVSIDGTLVMERAVTDARESVMMRRHLTASPGWHCLEVVTRAYQNTRPSLSLLRVDGRRAVKQQAIAPGGKQGAQRAKRAETGARALPERDPKIGAGMIAVSPLPDAGALALIRRLTFDPDRALFGRVLGTLIAISFWIDDVELAHELLDGTELAAPRSAVVHVSHARVMMWSSLPEGLSQAALRQALELDPSYPSVLLALAQIVWKDSSEDAEELIERVRRAAPQADGPDELAFRLAKQRGWNAEAAASLQAAIAKNATPRLLTEGAQFYRGLQRVAEAALLEKRAREIADPEQQETIASQAQARGDLDGAVAAHLAAAGSSDDGPDHLTRAAEIELGRGRIAEAAELAERALSLDPVAAQAIKVLLRAAVAKKDAPGARAQLARLQALGETSLRMEASIAAVEGRDLEVLDSDPWVKKALALELMPLIEYVPGTKTPRGLDPSDRWSRHRSVLLIDRVVDAVRPDGRSLSLRHSVMRLQTKEATDAAGEINLPPDSLTLALRTLKPDGRSFEVDRHTGKEDLSFSGLAAGDAVERKWMVLDEAATPWGGYLRRFYFQSTSPIVRSDLTVIVPKGVAVWTKSYNGAPQPQIHELPDRTVYHWRQDEAEPFEPEPHSVPYDEYIPFVVVSAGVDAELADRANVLGIPEAARISHPVRKQAEELVAGVENPEEKLERIFSWVTSEVGLGGTAETEQVLATRRGERTGLLTALLRAVGFDARIVLAKPGTSAQLEPTYPNPTQYNLRFVRIEWGSGERRWARVDTDTPWLGLLPPSMRNGHYLMAEANLRPIAVRDEEIERWPLESTVELTIDDNGTAKGKVVMRLPGTFGAELRDFVQRARKDEIMRHFQGWIGTVIPGARLLETKTNEEPAPAPLILEADVLIGHFMVRDGTALVAEQLFDAPLAHVSLGLPTLVSYLRVPNRRSPLVLTELTERMTVTLRFPKKCGSPLEAPRSFHRGADWGVFDQKFDWDAESKVATLVVEQATPQARLSPTAFSAFRESAQEILQASRNRLIVPIQLENAEISH